MQGFPKPRCKTHPNQIATHICWKDAWKFICERCLADSSSCSLHKGCTIQISTFIAYIGETATNLEKLDQRANIRYNQLIDLSSKFKRQYAQQDEEIIHSISRELQSENKDYKEALHKYETARAKIINILNLKKYLKPFEDPVLYDIKLNLSSQKGLKEFFTKKNKLQALFIQGSTLDMKNTEKTYLSQYQKLAEMSKNSFLQKLNETLAHHKKLKPKEAKVVKPTI